MNLSVIIVSLVMFGSIHASAQSFVWSKQGGNVNFTNDSTKIAFTDYSKNPDKTRTRTVTINGDTYILSVTKTIYAGKMQAISDSKGTKLATVFLGSIKKHNILLADGYELLWESKGAGSWEYKLNNQPVLKARYQKEGAEKKLFIEALNSQVVSPEVLIACLEHGADVMTPPSSRAALIIIPVLLAMVRAASM